MKIFLNKKNVYIYTHRHIFAVKKMLKMYVFFLYLKNINAFKKYDNCL